MSDDLADDEIGAVRRAWGGWFQELEQMLEEEAGDDPWMREATPGELGDPDQRLFALFNAGSIAAAVYDAQKRPIAATAAFDEAGCAGLVDPALLDETGGALPRLTTREADADHGPALFVYAPAKATATWRLPPDIHRAARGPSAATVVLTSVGAVHPEPLGEACRAYRLSGLQTRVALETIRTGAIKEAAKALDVSYQTAREALADAMKRVGVERAPGLITRLTTLAFGVLPGGRSSADLLADMWGLTERQITIAGLVAEGLSRAQTAHALGLGEAVVKKELDIVFSVMQVRSGAALARKLVEARALNWLTEATAGGMGFVEDTVEPLSIVIGPHRRQIAFSDYGPSGGRPVLVVHSSMTTRIVSRRLLRALHGAGFRPIAVDRPGFGLTEPLPDEAASHDPFADATADVAHVLDRLKIRSVDVVSRGGAAFVMALAGAMPDRLGRIVIVNPGPPYRESGRALGPIAVMKDAFLSNPASVRVIAPFLAGQLTYRRVARMMTQWTRGSPPDEAAVRDPEIVNDYYRSLRMFATGRFAGFVREQTALLRADEPEPVANSDGWRVLAGVSDVLYEPERVLAYWRALLPGARFEAVEDGGRFLAMTHPHLVVEALEA
jgi:pimeloyl-ACP methyl ester carboxylesterase/DNA-binding CsgD family transcriptional regulator